MAEPVSPSTAKVPLPRLLALLALLAALGGCATLSDSIFLLGRLDNQEKAEALVSKGADLFETELRQAGNLAVIPTVRRYFEVALRYDPWNERAAAGLEELDGFRRGELDKRVKLAIGLSGRSERTPEESYALCLAVRQASILDPQDDRVAALRRETRGVRADLVAGYLREGRQRAAEVSAGDSAAQQVDGYMEALGWYQRILTIQPGSGGALAQERALRRKLLPLLRARLAGIRAELAADRFENAWKGVEALRRLDRQAGALPGGELEELACELNVRWARRLFEQQRYAEADARVSAALEERRSAEILALKRRIAAAEQKKAREVGFVRLLRQVDELIAQDRLGAALRLLGSSLPTADRSERQELEGRRERVRQRLSELYRRGVDLYREESFREAADLLVIVVDADPGYRQARSYLEKARAKQKLLESL